MPQFAPPAGLPKVVQITADDGRPQVAERLESVAGAELAGGAAAAALRGRATFLYESGLGIELPGYRERRHLRLGFEEVHGPSALVIFTDPAHSAYVWTWRTGPRAGRYLEHRVPGGERPLSRDLAADRVVAAGGEVEPFEDRHLRERLEVELTRMIRFGRRAAHPTGSAPAEWIERCDSPATLREIWRALLDVSILHVGCTGDDWLLRAGRALEPLYLRCIDRMRSFLIDASIARQPRRPEYLRDFRRILQRLDDIDAKDPPVRFVRRTIVRVNLFGAADDDVRECGEGLLEYAGVAGDRLPYLDANVRRLPTEVLTSAIEFGWPVRLPALAAEANVGGGGESEPCEEATVLARVLQMLREQRYFAGRPTDALRRAAATLERRRRLMVRQSAPLDAGREGAWLNRLRMEFLRLGPAPPFRIVRAQLPPANRGSSRAANGGRR